MALAASAVATVGTIVLIGLIAPHAARLPIGHHHRRLLWFSALLDALLLVLADLVGRTGTSLGSHRVPARSSLLPLVDAISFCQISAKQKGICPTFKTFVAFVKQQNIAEFKKKKTI